MSRQDAADPISVISPEAITPRQLEVAKLVAEGRTNAEIADALGITLDGAKFHVSGLLTRLGLRRREEVATWYRAHFGRAARLRSFTRGVLGLPIPGLTVGGASIGGAVAVAGLALVATLAVVAVRGAAPDEVGPPEYVPFVQEWEIEHVGGAIDHATLEWNGCGEWTYRIHDDAGAILGTARGDAPSGDAEGCHIPGVWFREVGSYVAAAPGRQQIEPFEYEFVYTRDCSEVSAPVEPGSPLGPDFCATPGDTFEDRVVAEFDPETQIPMRYSQYVDGVLTFEHRAVGLTLLDEPSDLTAP